MMGAARGNWNEVWEAFDRRKSAKTGATANEGEGELFGHAAVAAE